MPIKKCNELFKAPGLSHAISAQDRIKTHREVIYALQTLKKKKIV